MFVTVVVPTGKAVPDGGDWGSGITIPELSVAVQNGNVTITSVVPDGTVLMMLILLQSTTGFSQSSERPNVDVSCRFHGMHRLPQVSHDRHHMTGIT